MSTDAQTQADAGAQDTPVDLAGLYNHPGPSTRTRVPVLTLERLRQLLEHFWGQHLP